jgi:6-phosphogluconolactonase
MPRTVVYVSCAAELAVVSFRLDAATGVLSPHGRAIADGTLDPPPSSMPLALTRNGRRLYAGARNAPYQVTAFAVNTDGTLLRLGSGRLADSMAYLSTDAAGRFLYGASYHGAKIAMNVIGTDGVPGEPDQVIATPPRAHSILPDPEGHAVYAAVLGADVILRQAVDPDTGRMAEPLTPIALTAPGAGPRHLRFARGGSRVYCLNELAATLDVYARDAGTGALDRLQSVRVVPPAPPGETLAGADLHLTPDERFLFASERRTSVLAGFHLREDGRLDAIGTVPAEPVPRGFAIDAHGRWLFAAGQDSGRVAVYAIDARSGALTRVGDYAAGGNANWIEIIDLVE